MITVVGQRFDGNGSNGLSNYYFTYVNLPTLLYQCYYDKITLPMLLCRGYFTTHLVHQAVEGSGDPGGGAGTPSVQLLLVLCCHDNGEVPTIQGVHDGTIVLGMVMVCDGGGGGSVTTVTATVTTRVTVLPAHGHMLGPMSLLQRKWGKA